MSTALPSPPVRVVLADMSRLTRELISRILEAEPEVQLVGELTAVTLPLRQLIEKADADVLIVGAGAPGLAAECRELLDQHARLRVLVVSADGDEARLHGVRPYELGAKEFSPDFLLDVVRKPETLGRIELAEPAGFTAQGGRRT